MLEGQVAKVGEDLCIIEVDEEVSNLSNITITHEKEHEVPSKTRRPHPLDPNTPPTSEPSVSTSRPLSSSELTTTRKATTTDMLAEAERTDASSTRMYGRTVSRRVGKIAGEQHAAATPPLTEEEMVVELGRITSTVSSSSFYAAPAAPARPASCTYDKLTYLPILVKMLSEAMHAWPLFRSSITPGWTSKSDSKPTLTLRPHADISIGLSTPTGLYTPTLHAVDTHSVYSLASALKHVAHLGRQVPSALTPAELPRRAGRSR
ncbi:hypothetical protein BC827DRAFT_1266371 [Russula dissimulans]|nr:hypothetical protein BC827DRAFT_1266371 [Russula dissimulans]